MFFIHKKSVLRVLVYVAPNVGTRDLIRQGEIVLVSGFFFKSRSKILVK